MIRDGRVVVLPRLLIGELHKFPELARFYKADGRRPRAWPDRRGCIAAASQSGEFRPQDSEAVARLVVAPALMMAIWRAVFAPHETEPFDPARVLDAHVDNLLRGLAP